MTVETTIREETEENLQYDVSVSSLRRSVTLSFTLTRAGILGFDNRQPDARACANRQISLALASEMARTARQRVPGALRGRTQRGLAFELRVHYAAYRLGIFRAYSVTTEMGSLDPDAPDYDHNAAWFEHPLRSLPKIVKATLFPG